MDYSTPAVLPPAAPYLYQPVEASYSVLAGTWTANWGVRRLSTGDVLATLTAPDDSALDKFASGVTFYFDAAGNIIEAYGYGTGKNRNRQLKLANKKGTAIYHEQAVQMRQRLLAEPVRSLPILARHEVDGAGRLYLLARNEPSDCEIISVREDTPTDVIRWHGYSLEDTLEQALPTRRDMVWSFYDATVRDVYDRLVLAPQREARRVAELTAQACADVASLALGIRKLLRQMRGRQDHTVWLDAADEPQAEAARQMEVNGWGHITHPSGWSSTQPTLVVTEAGQQVVEALAASDAKEFARHPFDHEGFESSVAGPGLTPADWRALFDRVSVPLVVQSHPMFGGTRADYNAWLASLPPKLAKAAAGYRAAVLAGTKLLHAPAAALTPLMAAIRDWHTLRPEDTTGKADSFTVELAGRALMGLEDEIKGAPQPCLPPLRRLETVKTFPGGMTPNKPTGRQRAALEWPCEAKESFAEWLGRMATLPNSEPLTSPEAVTRQSGQWSDWEARQMAIASVLAFLEQVGLQTESGQPVNLRTGLRAMGWDWTFESISATYEAAGFQAVYKVYAAWEKPARLPLSQAEEMLYQAMAGQAIGQTLNLESADYWDKFRLPPFSGEPEIVLDGHPSQAEDADSAEPVIMRGALPAPVVDAVALYLEGKEAMTAWITAWAAQLLALDNQFSEAQVRILAGGDLAAHFQDQWSALAERVEALLRTPDRMDPRDAARYDAIKERTEVDHASTPNEIIADFTGDRAILATADDMRQRRGQYARRQPDPPPAPAETHTYTLRCNGLGLLTLSDGNAPVTLTWLGGDDLCGDPQAVACARQLFATDLKRRRGSKTWTATATGVPV